jgi:hypothetical protein
MDAIKEAMIRDEDRNGSPVAAHTPGPWMISPRNAWRICNGKDNTIASTGGDSTLAGHHEANARLIAAAPEMLAALGRLVNDSMFKDHPEASQMAIDAIAKATGAP